MDQNIIQFREISKRYGEEHVVCDIDLDVRNGEFLTILGPSGCGKTTLLKLLAGFELPDKGSITLAGKEITELPPEKRHVNMVFQSYALFPHMSVFDNIAFGLECQKRPRPEIDKRVNDALRMVKLDSLAQRKPGQLSGGQQQRVAIARAVINEPLVLLLDEPLSALDYKLRKNMQIELKQLQRRLGIAFVFVTHDQEEALSMADRVVVMQEGKIQQIGTPRDVYEEPCNLKVAQFIGEANIFETAVESRDGDQILVNLAGKPFKLENEKGFKPGEKLYLILRPEDLRVWDQTEVDDTSKMLPGKVEQVIYKGSTVDLLVRLDSDMLVAASEFFDEDDEKLEYEVGEKIWVEWLPGWEVLLPHE